MSSVFSFLNPSCTQAAGDHSEQADSHERQNWRLIDPETLTTTTGNWTSPTLEKHTPSPFLRGRCRVALTTCEWATLNGSLRPRSSTLNAVWRSVIYSVPWNAIYVVAKKGSEDFMSCDVKPQFVKFQTPPDGLM